VVVHQHGLAGQGLRGCLGPDFGWVSAPDPAGGAYSAPSDPLAGFRGPTSNRKVRGKGSEGRGRRRGKGSGGMDDPPQIWSWLWACLTLTLL